MSNIVYIGTSIDGCISSAGGSLDWMASVPNPEGNDLGFTEFMERVDAIIMGRVTFETVIGFGLGWHYPIPGIVLSSTMASVPEKFAEHVKITNGSLDDIVRFAQDQGYKNLYIDGGDKLFGQHDQ